MKLLAGMGKYERSVHANENERARMTDLAALKGLNPRLSRAPTIVYFHENLVTTLEARDALGAEAALAALETYTRDLGHAVVAARTRKAAEHQSA